MLQEITVKSINLLKELIGIPSFSREEEGTASAICKFLGEQEIVHSRIQNNVYALNKFFDPGKPSVLLNSHHDTVKPAKGYTLDPFVPFEQEGKIYGLGSNDAGGCLVSLIGTFLYFFAKENLPFNVVLAATAEEEISGPNGVELLLNHHQFITNTHHCFVGKEANAFALIGEPTLMQMAIAEKGLLVLDCTAQGKAGHAARNEGENALYKALKDIEWIQSYQFPLVSDLLGACKMTVTVIDTENKAHNVVPAQCRFTLDCRLNELYTHEEFIDIIKQNISSVPTPRSFRLRSTLIPVDHPLIQQGIAMGKKYYGSPTTSDKALIPFPALKIGPGDSARSHTADEFIYRSEIEKGIADYVEMLEAIKL